MPKADKKEEDDDVSSVEIDDAEEAEPDEATSNDLTNPDIVTKYRTAGDIANKALAAVLACACRASYAWSFATQAMTTSTKR